MLIFWQVTNGTSAMITFISNITNLINLPILFSYTLDILKM